MGSVSVLVDFWTLYVQTVYRQNETYMSYIDSTSIDCMLCHMFNALYNCLVSFVSFIVGSWLFEGFSISLSPPCLLCPHFLYVAMLFLFSKESVRM